MKILYVITKANWGGAQKYVYDLATAAKATGYEVAVAYGEAGVLVQKLGEADVRTLPLAGLTRDVGASEWRAYRGLLHMLHTERPDVVHLNSSKAGALGALACRQARVKRIIFTAHGWAFNEARPWWQKMIIYKIVWWTIALSHATICVSEAVRRDVAWMPFIKKKLAVIYNGVHEPEYLPREEAREALWPEHAAGLWVGMLSELHPTKRIGDAFSALTLIHQQYPEAKLVVMGEGEERARLESLIREYSLGDRVRLAGLVPEGDRYLKAFDLFLHTSQSEALGLAVIEAGLAGLPLVATRVGGIPEIVTSGETGLLVPPHSPAALARALASLSTEREKARQMGNALQKAVRERFNAERMVRETLALYAN